VPSLGPRTLPAKRHPWALGCLSHLWQASGSLPIEPQGRPRGCNRPAGHGSVLIHCPIVGERKGTSEICLHYSLSGRTLNGPVARTPPGASKRACGLSNPQAL
jgi:hypothetical protein